MKSSVAYLLGAGASAQALPVIGQIASELFITADLVENKWKLSDNIINPTIRNEEFKIVKSIAEDMKWLAEATSEHASVDTLAKKFYILKKHQELRKLKNVLSLFFILKEAQRKTDIRYDTFFASVLQEDHITFPDNVRILSWNYDNQFEKAYSLYSNNPSYQNARIQLNHFSKYSTKKLENTKFSLIKLNGYCGIFGRNAKEFKFSSSHTSINDIQELSSIYSLYYDVLNYSSDEYNTSLSFAWENNEEEANTFLGNVISATAHSKVLVIIGYSFPFFNREIDNKILRYMTNLEKVYIQSPQASLIADKFSSIIDIPTRHIKEIEVDDKSFFLPPEL